ncbi:MAG: hypothetical protein JHC95_15490 [Solirubrobacteraceae bacterium]|nr:hypothetical protein [Solirubrobacteraceae bacterium]
MAPKLPDIIAALQQDMGPAEVHALALRVRLNTGVDILGADAPASPDTETLERVMGALAAMGHDVSPAL